MKFEHYAKPFTNSKMQEIIDKEIENQSSLEDKKEENITQRCSRDEQFQ